MAEVAHLFVCPGHRLPMREMEECELIAEKGMNGCAHARNGGKRQVLMMAREALEVLNLEPGIVKENVTTRGLDHGQIATGKRLRIGNVVLEATIPCEPCYRMDEIRDGLKAKLGGRRGWLFRVAQGGKVRRGDSIEFVNSPASQAAA